jgi:hypothetical protein
MELFVKGEEEPLDDERRLSAADKVPLFMLPKPASDRLALEALFKSCGGADWRRKGGWMTEAELGEWHGVTLDAEGRVVELNLDWNNLAGALPSEIQQLSALTWLNLPRNKLTGAIPAELWQLGALESLYLDTNQLSSVIPAELAQLPALASLELHGNQLSGRRHSAASWKSTTRSACLCSGSRTSLTTTRAWSVDDGDYWSLWSVLTHSGMHSLTHSLIRSLTHVHHM